MRVLKTINALKTEHQNIKKTITQLKAKQKALKKAGIDYGSPSYKGNGKYLRIVRPATADRPNRQFEYVGADPVKQQQALSALDRGKEYDRLDEVILRLENALRTLDSDLYGVARDLNWSHQNAIQGMRA